MKLKNNIDKIRNEFFKLKIKLGIISYFSVLLLLAFISVIGALFIYTNYFLKDSIVDYLPADVIAYEGFRNLKNDSKLKDNFSWQIKKSIDINDSSVDKLASAREIGVIFFRGQEKSPIFAFKLDEKTEKEISIKQGVMDNWNNFLILAKDPGQLKNLSQKEPFSFKKQFKTFLRKKNHSLAFYFDLTADMDFLNHPEKKDMPIFDKIILANYKKRDSKIFGSIKKNNKSYELYVSGINNQKTLTLFVSDPKERDTYLGVDKQTLIGAINSNLYLPDSLSGQNLTEPTNDLICQFAKKFLASQDYFLNNSFLEKIFETETFLKHNNIEAKLFLLKNVQVNHPSEGRLHEYLMLGENYPYQFILALKNTKEAEKFLELTKDASLLYLDQEFPEGQDIELPDGTIVTGFVSAPERFKFEKMLTPKNYPVFSLTSKEIAFQITYSVTHDYIFLSGSRDRLINFLDNPDRESNFNDKSGEETFYLNLNNINIESDILNFIKNFGSSFSGVLTQKNPG